MKRFPLLNVTLLLATLIGSTLILIYITNTYILTTEFYERNGQPVSGIPDMESLVYEKVKTIIYVYSIVYVVLKVVVVSMILATGLYFFDVEISFSKLLRVVILCEFIFLLPAAIKIWWFWSDRNSVDLITWQNYYCLSAANFFSDIRPAFLLPLQTINVFEIAYWFLLAAGIEKITAVRFDVALKAVCSSYLPALFIWVIFVVYFTIVYFPQSY